MSRPLISVVAPVYNESASIEEFVARVRRSVEAPGGNRGFELILVDDGSTDGTAEVLRKLAPREPALRVIELRRNYGQTAALQAGMDAARGGIIVTMDADLQHFPEEIPLFISKLDEGYDVVCGWRHKRAEGLLRRWPSRAANLLIRRISGLAIHDFGTTYRAYRAEIVRELRLFGEFHRYIPALAKDIGARIAEIPIENIERPRGRSNYGLQRTFGVFLDLIVLHFLMRYMDRPMRIFGKLAALAFAAAAAILTGLFAYAYVFKVGGVVRERSGWFLLAIVLVLGAIQITLSGVLAEILARVHYGLGDRRVYKVRREWSGGDGKTG